MTRQKALFDPEQPARVGAHAEFPLLFDSYLRLAGTPIADEIATALNLIDDLRRGAAA